MTVIATGLGLPASLARQGKPQLVVSHKTGTDNQPVVAASAAIDYNVMAEQPAVFRSRRDRAAHAEALAASGVEKYDIPAFLRKQAD